MNIYVGNLPYSTTDADLQAMFQEFGSVQSAKVIIDRETGTTWDPVRGLGIGGALSGEHLGVLPGFTIFPEDFGTFWPEGRVWQP